MEDSVVVVVGGTAEAQAPTKPTNTATAAARATFFRSFILGLPQLGTLFGNREPLIRDFNFNSDSESHRRQWVCKREVRTSEPGPENVCNWQTPWRWDESYANSSPLNG